MTYYTEVPRCLDCDVRLFPGRGDGHFCHECRDLWRIDGFDSIPDAELVELHYDAAIRKDQSARLYALEIKRRLKSRGL